MKKLFAMLLALAMLLGAMAMAEAVDVTGTWYCTEFVQGDQSFNPADFGLNIVVTLNEDGTAAMDAGEPSEGTWTMEGDIVTITEQNGLETIMTLTDGNLVIEEDEVKMVLSREAAEGFTPAEAVEAAAAEDFNGAWEAYKASAFGMYVDMSATGQTASLTIEDGNVNLMGTLFGSLAGQTLSMEFADGALKLNINDQGNLELHLLVDGTLRLDMITEAMTAEIYLQPAEAAEEAPAA